MFYQCRNSQLMHSWDRAMVKLRVARDNPEACWLKQSASDGDWNGTKSATEKLALPFSL